MPPLQYPLSWSQLHTHMQTLSEAHACAQEWCLCFAEALVKMSRHLAALQFKECPSYDKLQSWLSELTPADVSRPLRPPAGKKALSSALPGAPLRSIPLSAFSKSTTFMPPC